MWITILVMAVAVSLEPFRIGMTVLMLNRPRPILQLLAFLCGGFAMGMTVGLAVLFVFRHRLAVATHLSLPMVQIIIGTLALLLAAILAIKVVVKQPPNDDEPRRGKLSTRARRLLQNSSPWVAALAGLGIALPSVDYLSALAVILASGATATSQGAALVTFNVLAFAPVEIPLIAYLLAPDATVASMAALNEWIRSRRRGEVATVLAVVGCVLLAIGVASL
jgi:hypothetical protein